MSRLTNLFFFLFALTVAVVIVSGCTKKETITQPIITTAPKFLVTPDTLHVVDTSPTATVYLSTDAPGTLNWRITGKPTWITASPESGQATQTLRSVALTGLPLGLVPGTHGGTITFHSSGGVGSVFVLFAVAEHPSGAVSVSSLHWAAAETQKSFTLTNNGTGLLLWSASATQSWLTVSPPSGALFAGQSVTLFAIADRAGVAVGTAEAMLTIASNAEGGSISIPVTMEVPAAPGLEASPDSLHFDYFTDMASFKLKNTGNAPLTWSAAPSLPYLQLASTAGTINAGDSAIVGVTVNRSGLATGVFAGGITVMAPALPTEMVGVSVRHFEETKWLLGETIADAEYDRVNDRIVAVGGSSSPRLLVLDPDARTVQSVALPLASECVSIRPDGLYAAAGHNGFVSYVNLTSMTIEQTYAVTTNAIDVVLPSNGWVYVFPRTDQWETIRCINLSTGAETLHSGRSIRAGTLVRLHPSGNYIYGANNGLSPSDIEKYDIRSGTAIYMYDSPYHGDFAFSGNLWIADDGTRIFARSGNAFLATESQSNDMTYNGNLAGATNLQWVEQSTRTGRLYVLLADGSFGPPAPSELRTYNSSFLAFLGAQPLPPFLVPNGGGGGTLHSSSGRFVFANMEGTRVHVVVKAASGSGLINDWAIASFDQSALP